jgi:hypothetical protein
MTLSGGPNRRTPCFATVLGTLLLACGEVDDRVFSPLTIVESGPLFVVEGTRVVEVPLRLSGRHEHRVVARFRAVPDEAQNDCQFPDFEAAERTVEWAPGQEEVTVSVYIGEDEIAETDERFLLEIEPLEGLPAAGITRLEVVIGDNDRTALIDAAARGVVPGRSNDVAPELQAVFDEAASFGRAVIVMARGEYEISTVRLPPGTTLSAHGVTWRRPPASATDVVSLRLEHVGPDASEPSLVEGLAIDGRRDAQGPYRDRERQDAHLVALLGDVEAGGRMLATLEGLELSSGTGSGVKIGSEVDISLCRLSANELWRDAITATGGGTRVRIRGVDATATEGTGLWLGPRELGFEDSLVMDAEVENVLIGAGDVEIEATSGSSVIVRRLIMTRPPFRLEGLDGAVRIADSVLMVGVPSELHNHFGLPHDVEIIGTTLVASETPYPSDPADAQRTFAAVWATADVFAPSPPAAGPGRLVFDGCRFEIAGDVEADDVVYAVESGLGDVAVTLRGTTLGSGFADWFSPECTGCTREP